MNKNYFYILLLMIFIFQDNAFTAADVPANESGMTKELNVHSLYKINELFTAILAIEIKDPAFDEQQRAIHFGPRYSLNDNFKLGLFAGYIHSQRHNDNWVKEGTSWKWNNHKKDETIIYPELSYRNLYNDLVYEFKLKYVFSRAFDEKYFFVKLNLIQNLSPDWIVILSDEVKLSPSNKEKTLSENWAYLSPFFKVSRNLMIGPTLGFFKRFWTTSAVHKTLRTNTYQAHDSSVSVGLNVNFYLN